MCLSRSYPRAAGKVMSVHELLAFMATLMTAWKTGKRQETNSFPVRCVVGKPPLRLCVFISDQIHQSMPERGFMAALRMGATTLCLWNNLKLLCNNSGYVCFSSPWVTAKPRALLCRGALCAAVDRVCKSAKMPGLLLSWQLLQEFGEVPSASISRMLLESLLWEIVFMITASSVL